MTERKIKSAMLSLEEEETGGAPNIMGYDKATGEITFAYCSPEAPGELSLGTAVTIGYSYTTTEPNPITPLGVSGDG